jgi:Fic family protein
MPPLALERSAPEITSEAVIEALSNDHDRRILSMAQQAPIEAQEVIKSTDIPKTTVYRRIQDLEERGLLATVGVGCATGTRSIATVREWSRLRSQWRTGV